MAKLNLAFSGIKTEEAYDVSASRKGVALKTAILLLLAVASGVLFPLLIANKAIGLRPLIGILIAMLVMGSLSAFIGQWFPKASMVCSFIYAICEGSLLGLVSLVFEAEIQGIVLSAVLITGTLFAVMLFLYATRIIRVTNKFVAFFATITITLVVALAVYFIAALINPTNPLVVALQTNRWIMIGVSVFLILYGAFMLLMDFNYIERIVEAGFDKRYEWTAALGLMITIVWIYVEALRLLAILTRDN